MNVQNIVQQPQPKTRLVSLEILRALATIIIFVSHSFDSVSGIGSFGVSIFFVLSGFLMSYSYNDRELSTNIWQAFAFSARKIKKLYILHIAIVIFMLFRSGYMIQALYLNVFLIKTWHPLQTMYFSLGGVSWFLCDIAFMYVMFPYILKRIKRLKSKKTAIWHMICVYSIMFAAGYASTFVRVPETVSTNFPKWFTYIFPVFRMGDYIIGCDLGYIFLKQKESCHIPAAGQKRTATIIEVFVFACVAGLLFLRINMVGLFKKAWFGLTLCNTPIVVALVYTFACNQGAITGGLTKVKLFYLIADLSMYTYLIHPRVISLCKENIHLTRGGVAETYFVVILIAFVLTQYLGCLCKLIFKK